MNILVRINVTICTAHALCLNYKHSGGGNRIEPNNLIIIEHTGLNIGEGLGWKCCFLHK